MSIDLENNNNENLSDKKFHKRNIFSLNDSDIQILWDYVSDFIESSMLKQKGVNILGLGMFSFNQVKLDIGQNKYMLLQRPLFLLSEKICQNHNLKQSKTQVTGSIPVIPLNYSSLMIKSSYPRDQVETCVRELITATNNSIANQSATELVFTRIGRLQIRNQEVKFKFYKNFISMLDSSGKIVNTMQNRPGTADSVMSERPLTRSFSNVLPLPRIPSLNDCEKLPTINELDMFESRNPNFEDPNVLRIEENHFGNSFEQTQEEIEGEASGQIFNKNDSKSICDSNNYPGLSGEQGFNVKINPSIDSHPMFDESISSNKSTVRNDNIIEQTSLTESDLDLLSKPLPTPKPPLRSFLLAEPKKPSSVCSGRPSTSASSICGHPGPSGQELCYVCYQREKRNIPISFAEQLKEREKEEERVLQAYQNMKDTEHLMKEQETLLSKKYDSQKISAFNAGVAEAIKTQHKSKDPNMYRSYLFESRPLTPPKIIKQSILSSELDKQVERKVTTKKKNDEEEAFIERLEQMQLAEDLAKQRDQYLKDKEKSKDLYKKALDTQVVNKPLPIPKLHPDSEPVFGKNDVNQEKLIEKRLKAQDILKSQMECAEQKKREVLMKKLQEQTQDEKILDKVKQDLIEDRARRYQRAMQNRMKLENEWEKAKEEKKERDLVDRLKISMPDSLLMHEQCDKYSRCAQCKRKVQNVGQSNIWKETYFIPGTRYIY